MIYTICIHLGFFSLRNSPDCLSRCTKKSMSIKRDTDEHCRVNLTNIAVIV